ncbi:MAG: ATP phosphoribosyltransferase regulatory subunit [Microcoleaceae cyanobacterium MO_207.B10]|nr:ATP phosphoribosyltransferase regulatory subunit [Microcoleaceae cyanobacterium MO_207.B10]
MRITKVERVRGVNDILPDTYQIEQYIKNTLSQCFESYGYRPIDVPLIEYTELYLKKSGEDIVSRLYDFVFRNRRLCLRPEFTASVVRAYLDNLKSVPLPVRLYYMGPAFRYERPQKERYRQFTQMGIELIGATGAIADAEIISSACQGLDHLGLTQYRVVIGHIGVVNKFLDNLQLETRLRSFLISNIETFKKEGKQTVENRLQKIFPAFSDNYSSINESATESTNKKLADILQNMKENEARTAIFELLDSMNIGITGTRKPEEIVDRLLIKLKRQDQTKQLNQALEFIQELVQIKGEPIEVLKEAERLLSNYSIDTSSLKQLHEIVETLGYYNIDKGRISFDLGVSRGLQYYTGMIFEIYHGKPGEERQICGGGRYDDLILNLGGKQETPATGFSYGMERLRQALETEGKIRENDDFVDILVVAVGEEDYGYAITVAEKLRKVMLKVELDVRSRNISSNLQYATKQNIPYVIIVGPEERMAAEVVLKNMASGEQQNLEVSEVISKIKG